MMHSYRESYIRQLKKENQALWEELSDLERNSVEWKKVRRSIEINDTEISTMQDIIKRSMPINALAEV